MATGSAGRTRVFVSYSHDDQRWRDKLMVFLKPLERKIDLWTDERIKPGSRWLEEINEALEESHVAILLVSANFLSSDFVMTKEVPVLLAAAERRGLKIIPIVVGACVIPPSLAEIQAFNRLDKPLEALRPARQNAVLAELAQQISDIVAYHPDPAPALPRPAIAPENLPRLPDGFVGRKADIEHLRQLVQSGGIVVVHGIFGIGKSRLALEVAHQAYRSNELPGGVAWINYETYQGYDEYLRQVAQVLLGNRLERLGSKQCEQQLGNYLQTKKSLVVVDNVRTLSPELELVSWLKQVPAPSCVLITADALPPIFDGCSQCLSIHELEDTDAQGIFVQRARSVRPDLSWSGERDQAQIREICREVGNHPMVLDMIAIRYAARLPLGQLVKRAEEYAGNPEEYWRLSLDPLYDELNADARTMLMKLSVLSGTIGDRTIEIVTGIQDWAEAAEKLASLSMWALGPNDRYTVHTLVRNFALQKLGGQRAQVEREVAAKLASQAKAISSLIQPGTHSLPDMREGLDWFEAEWANLKDCVRYAQQGGDAKSLCLITDAVLQFMICRGHLQDCEALYETALQVRRDIRDRLGEARTCNDLGVCMQFQNRLDEAVDRLEASIQLQRQLLQEGDQRIKLVALPKSYNSQGYVYQEKGIFEEAENKYREAEKICNEIRARHDLSAEMRDEINLELSQTYSNLGLLLTRRFERDPSSDQVLRKAEDAFRKSLTLRNQDDPRRGQVYNRLASVCLLKGSWAQAASHFQRGITYLRQVEDIYELGIAHRGLGITAQHQGRWEEARVAYEESLRYFQSQYYLKEVGDVLIRLAEGNLEVGELAVAEQWVQNALDTSLVVEDQGVERNAFEILDRIARLQQ